MAPGTIVNGSSNGGDPAGAVTRDAPGETEPSALRSVVVRNETAARLRVRPGRPGGEAELNIAPFETLDLAEDQWERWEAPLRTLERRRLVQLLRHAKPEPGGVGFAAFLGLALWAILGLLIWAAVVRTTPAWMAVGAAVLLVAIVSVAWLQRDLIARLSPSQAVTLGAALVVSGLIPAITLYIAADVGHTIDGLGGANGHASELELLGRGVQLVFIWVASFLPAGLFFLFDRVKLDTLRETFERGMLRFDPTTTTLADVRARYGPLMSETFPPEPPGRRNGGLEPASDLGAISALAVPHARTARSSRSISLDRRVPVVLATVVIALGWTIAILNPDLNLERGDSAGFMLGLLEPQASPIVFAFLGAYMFTLLALLRSYVRSDLRPKSYTHAAVRIVIAIISAWVLEVLLADPSATAPAGTGLLVVAFVVGFFPETLMVRLQEVARSFARTPLGSFYERYPLTQLDGIDIYDRARLLDEGVGNIEGLAHHDLPQLMLQTRIPVGRIVQWTDQAILHLHVAVEPDSADDAAKEAADAANARLRTLSSHGILTATDLLREAHASAAQGARAQARFLALLDDPDAGPSRGRPHRVTTIVEAIKGEQWIAHLLCWRDPRHAGVSTITVEGSGDPGPPVVEEETLGQMAACARRLVTGAPRARQRVSRGTAREAAHR